MVAMLATALDARPTTPSTSENLSAYGTSVTVCCQNVPQETVEN